MCCQLRPCRFRPTFVRVPPRFRVAHGVPLVAVVAVVASWLLVNPAGAEAQQPQSPGQGLPVRLDLPAVPGSRDIAVRATTTVFSPPVTSTFAPSDPSWSVFGPRVQQFDVEHTIRGLAVDPVRRFSYELTRDSYSKFADASQRLGTTFGSELFARGGTPSDGLVLRSDSTRFEMARWDAALRPVSLKQTETGAVEIFRDGRLSTSALHTSMRRLEFGVPSSAASPGVVSVKAFAQRASFWQPSLVAFDRAREGSAWIGRANAGLTTGLQALDAALLFRNLVDLQASAVQMMTPSPFFLGPGESRSVVRTVSSQIGPFILGDASLSTSGSYATGRGYLVYNAAVNVQPAGFRSGTVQTRYETREHTPAGTTLTVVIQSMPSQNAVERYAAIYFPAAAFDPAVTSLSRYVHTVHHGTTTVRSAPFAPSVLTSPVPGVGPSLLPRVNLPDVWRNALLGGNKSVALPMSQLHDRLFQSWHNGLEPSARGFVASPQPAQPWSDPLSPWRTYRPLPVQTVPAIPRW